MGNIRTDVYRTDFLRSAVAAADRTDDGDLFNAAGTYRNAGGVYLVNAWLVLVAAVDHWPIAVLWLCHNGLSGA